eukprot:2175458-Pleurochrysis_carterae.AAC.1
MGKVTASEESISEPFQLGAGGAAADGGRRVGGAGHGVGGVAFVAARRSKNTPQRMGQLQM